MEFSRLGFGCAGLMARLDRRRSLRLLETAFDAGITHFDAARSYGYGEAEAVLGDLLSTRRYQVTVTSKIGILPPRNPAFFGAAKQVARIVAAFHPAVRRALRRRAGALVNHGVFEIGIVNRSLEDSLRALRTDYIDLLLLHECTPTDFGNEDLLRFLERCRADGKIRNFGIATSIETTMIGLYDFPAFCHAVQFANNAWNDGIERIGVPPGVKVITHSSMGARFAQFQKRLSTEPALRQALVSALGEEYTRPDRLGMLLLAYAMASNLNGCVLFSTHREAIIRKNVTLDPRSYRDMFHGLQRFLKEHDPIPVCDAARVTVP